jgi:hypothetical protein
MFSKSLSFFTGLMLVASPAVAADQSASKAPSRAQEKTYCLQLEAFTGSRISRTECKTKKQWELEGVNIDEVLAK